MWSKNGTHLSSRSHPLHPSESLFSPSQVLQERTDAVTLNSPLESRFPWCSSRRPPRSSRKWLGRRIRSPRTLQPPYCSVHGRDPARMLSRTTDTSGSARPLAGTDSIVRFSNLPLPFELEMRHLEGHEGGSCTATESNLSRPDVAEWSAEDVELRSACKRKGRGNFKRLLKYA